MRKSIVAAATALTVVATGLGVAGLVGTARPADAAIGDVPADCGVFTAAYRSDGQRLSYGYDDGRTSTKEYRNDNLGWVPSAHQQLGGSGDDTVFRSTEVAAHPTDGWLYKISRAGELQDDGNWTITASSADRLVNGFASTRVLASASPYLFRVAGTSLYRYQEKYVDGEFTYSAPVKLATNWGSVNTLTYEGTQGTGSSTVDVLIGTKSNGELREWKINRATPTKITGKTLRSTGWGSFTSLSTGYCDAHPNGRPLLAITADGRGSVHFDANSKDGVATDMKGASLGQLGWTAKGYGQ
ncbi:hypothetical protein [Kribbella italica]|uniref:Uncharacterized protein n=1 Tax=Kribbella italica TaxID=1540520 RepID=A0A7W9MWQ9_9ACTN|nr:hypothetical protein [Kribbella italica]MBB5838562.1 hypothetical protein [Kribbella italica]